MHQYSGEIFFEKIPQFTTLVNHCRISVQTGLKIFTPIYQFILVERTLIMNDYIDLPACDIEISEKERNEAFDLNDRYGYFNEEIKSFEKKQKKKIRETNKRIKKIKKKYQLDIDTLRNKVIQLENDKIDSLVNEIIITNDRVKVENALKSIFQIRGVK